jgi:hypothetical protein
MRKDNTTMKRVVADDSKIIEQLEIIRDDEKISAVCFLTGERLLHEDYFANVKKVLWCINNAFSMGFKKIYFNIGSLEYEAIQYIKDNVKGEPVLSLFQETYEKDEYLRYFGRNKDSNPKSDFDKRYNTPFLWLEAGFSRVDTGILLGYKPLGSDFEYYNEHIAQMRDINKNAEIHISLPRIKNGMIGDIEYKALIIKIKQIHPDCKLILTTRETIAFINSVIEYVDVISPGCSDICPYTREGAIYNNVETSQFVINSVRERPSTILEKIDTTQILFYEGAK